MITAGLDLDLPVISPPWEKIIFPQEVYTFVYAVFCPWACLHRIPSGHFPTLTGQQKKSGMVKIFPAITPLNNYDFTFPAIFFTGQITHQVLGLYNMARKTPSMVEESMIE